MSFARKRGIRVRVDKAEEIEDPVAEEHRVRLFINDRYFCDLIASPGQLRELGAGFVICEGLARHVRDVRVAGEEIFVDAEEAVEAEKEIGTSGGVSVETPASRVSSGLIITLQDVAFITSQVESELWRQTGGVHCSVLWNEGSVVAKSSDVGRHNTVDKVVGSALFAGIDLSRCVIGCTGRQPAGMVVKAARAGIPVIISRAASTDRGIGAAGESGITLICFSRENRFTVYSNSWRVRELAGPGCTGDEYSK